MLKSKSHQTTNTNSMKQFLFSLFALAMLTSCGSSDDEYQDVAAYPNITATFGSTINLNSLPNYANQVIPNYITKNNVNGNPITDKGATLGRVLFYDKNLSSTNTIACASCHIQANAFAPPS